MMIFWLAMAVQAAEPARLMPPDGYLIPPVAADHVALVEAHSDGRPTERFTVRRSGPWLREERHQAGRTRIDHYDYGSATRITFFADGNGRYRQLSLERPRSSDRHNLYSRSRTGERGEALGESCEIWRISRSAPGIDWFSCETADGIPPWTRAQWQSSGEVFATSRIVEFRRGDTEARSSTDLLNWNYWRSLAAPPPPPVETYFPERDYDVLLRARNSATHVVAQVMRRRGDSAYVESSHQDGSQWTLVRRGMLTLAYHEERRGLPLSLAIYPSTDTDNRGRYRSFDQRESILGEECLWWYRFHVEPIVTSVGRDQLCVTPDGVPLALVAGQWHGPDLVAVAASRTPPPAEVMEPPPRAFDWDIWGMTPTG